MRKVWYEALTKDMKSHGGFADARKATMKAAAHIYGDKSAEFTAVQQAWDSVGITDVLPKETITNGMSAAFKLQAMAQRLGALRNR